MEVMQILAMESFDRGSHRQFREVLTKHSGHHWHWITNEETPWKWSMRLGGLLPLGYFPPPDAFFCTSLLDVAVARTQVEAKIGRRVPTVLYMHENQVEYPDDPEREADRRDVHFALTNLNSIFAADLVLWNSRWNLDSFLAGLGEILHPCRGIPFDDLEERIRARSNVAWCPVEVPSPELPCPIEPSDVPLAVWPHRHEHDKGPDLLLELARSHRNIPIRWALLGERFDRVPDAMKIGRAHV